MNDGLYYNSQEGSSQLSEFGSYLDDLVGTISEIDSLLGTMESGWTGEQSELAISSFKTQKDGLNENAATLKGQLGNLTSTYEAFNEARVDL